MQKNFGNTASGHARTTPRRKCAVIVRTAAGLPVPCGDPAFKAHRCSEHYADWQNARETRRGTQAVNPKRQVKKASGLSGRQWVRARKAERKAVA